MRKQVEGKNFPFKVPAANLHSPAGQSNAGQSFLVKATIPMNCSSSCDVGRAVRMMLSASACPQMDVMYAAMARADPPSTRPLTFMSVGCNRGDDLVRFAQVFDNTRTYNHNAWVRAQAATGLAANQDVCGASVAKAEVASTWPAWGSAHRPTRPRPPVAICVEGMRGNVRLLNETLLRVPELRGRMNVVASAFGSAAEVGTTAVFPDCPPGTEQSGMHLEHVRCPHAKVNIDSVDSFCRRAHIHAIDALFVDTEGACALCLPSSRLHAGGAPCARARDTHSNPF